MPLDPKITILGSDPSHRACILNGNAFQQDAIVSLHGWQYAAFYSSLSSSPEPLFVHLARRKLPDGPWEVLVLNDYEQTADDGHNTVQLGLCAGDGTIHLAFDHHCDKLRYRHSIPGLATKPASFEWTSTLFSPTLSHLPGQPLHHKPLSYVTYPRFGNLGVSSQDMFLSVRDGKAGLGADHLYLYRSSLSSFAYVGAFISGVWSNPYVHGISSQSGRLHVTWVWRGFVEYPGWDDPADTKHKAQAGPNGAENNHDLCYAYSDDDGVTWKNGGGEVVADLSAGGTVTNGSKGVVAFTIPKGCGLTNQESQAVDQDGGVHVLNRDSLGGSLSWKHYYRSPEGVWSRRALPFNTPTKRGRLAVSRDGDLVIILPEPDSKLLRIVRATEAEKYANYEQIWVGQGFSGEPLVDTPRLQLENILSLFIRADAEGEPQKKNVVVVDFQL